MEAEGAHSGVKDDRKDGYLGPQDLCRGAEPQDFFFVSVRNLVLVACLLLATRTHNPNPLISYLDKTVVCSSAR